MPNPLEFSLLMACGFVLFRARRFDKAPLASWAVSSLGMLAFTWLYLRQGLTGNLIGQVFVCFSIGVVQMVLEYRDRRK
jgi:hypothetical protein